MSLDFHDMPGFLIRRLHQISSSIFVTEIEKLNIDITPVQFATLSTLEHFPGIDQTALAGIVGYDRVTIGGVLQRLVEKKYADKKANVHDRRSYSLEVSELGSEILRKISSGTDKLHEGVLVGLTEAENQQLMKLLKKAVNMNNTKSRSPLVAVSSSKRGIKKAKG